MTKKPEDVVQEAHLKNIIQSISTGVSARVNVNVIEAKAVGAKIVGGMNRKSVAEYTPRKDNQCLLMTSKCPSSDRKQVLRFKSYLDFGILWTSKK